MVSVICDIPGFSGTEVNFYNNLATIAVGNTSKVIFGAAAGTFMAARDSLLAGAKTTICIQPKIVRNLGDTFNRFYGISHSEFVVNKTLSEDTAHFGMHKNFFAGGLDFKQKKQQLLIDEKNDDAPVKAVISLVKVLKLSEDMLKKEPSIDVINKFIEFINHNVSTTYLYIAELMQARKNKNPLIDGDFFANLSIGSDGIIMGALLKPGLQRVPKPDKDNLSPKDKQKQGLESLNRQYHKFFEDPAKSAAATLYMSPGNVVSNNDVSGNIYHDSNPFAVLIAHDAIDDRVFTTLDMDARSILLLAENGLDVYSGIFFGSNILFNYRENGKLNELEPIVDTSEILFTLYHPYRNNNMQIGKYSTKFCQYTNGNMNQHEPFFNIAVFGNDLSTKNKEGILENPIEPNLKYLDKNCSSLMMRPSCIDLTAQSNEGGRNGILIAGGNCNGIKEGVQIIYNDENVISYSFISDLEESDDDNGNWVINCGNVGMMKIRRTDVILCGGVFMVKNQNEFGLHEKSWIDIEKGKPRLKEIEADIKALNMKVEARLKVMIKHLDSTNGFK